MSELQLSDEFLWDWFGMPDCTEREKESFYYAIEPYISREQYEQDKSLLSELNSASNPQDKYLLIYAAKVERTDKHILGIKE